MFIGSNGKIVILVMMFTVITAGIAPDVWGRSRSEKVKWVKSKDGVKALMKLGKSMDKSAKQLKEETKIYDRARRAAAEGDLKKGESASRVKKTIGEPVVVLFDERTNVTKWVYKPGNATFFDHKKVYLSFDENEELAEWKIVDGKKGEDEQ